MKIIFCLLFLEVCFIWRLCQAKSCPPGYYNRKRLGCMDIDECTSSPCDSSAKCRNLRGSYECYCDNGLITIPGSSGIATICQERKEHNLTDIDECKSSPCDPPSLCRNLIGSYECYCGKGFTPSPGSSGNATTCKDIDECTSSPCDSSAKCRNLRGSYECYCDNGLITIPGSSGIATICQERKEHNLTDIDECKSSPCDPPSLCRNLTGSYECYCGKGFTPSPGSSGNATTCKDIDECTSSPCDSSAKCRNLRGSYECYCDNGLITIPGSSGIATICQERKEHNLTDIDECKSSPCDPPSLCRNLIGSYECYCGKGFTPSPGSSGNATTCKDIDECTSSPCDSSAKCRNLRGSYECYCDNGLITIPGSSGIATICQERKEHNLTDIDECKSSPCDPPSLCRNLTGSYECYCGKGFTPSPGSSGNATTCKDVDECEDEDVCGKNATCVNSFGSYHCICQPVAEQTGKTCTVQPLNCPNPEKPNNSTLSQCGGKHSQTLKQTNSEGIGSCSAMEAAHKLLNKVCQNFSVTGDLQAVTNLTNGFLNRNSRLQNMTTSQRLNVVATILDLVENTAMAIALTLPRGETKSISADSFAAQIQVSGNQSLPDDLVRIEIWNNTMEINWRTVMGAKNSDFAAVAFFVFSDMESLLTSEIRKDGVKQLEATEGTSWLNSKVVTARISNKAASRGLTEMVNFTLKFNQDTNDHEKAKCVYLKITDGGSFWSPEGCFLIGSSGSSVMCQCDHLTSFAILMSPIEIEESWSLLLISTAGLTISLLCLAASIVVFTKCRSIQKANIIVYKHLSINLFLAQLIFLTGIHVTNKVVCALVAGCLHYFFLTVFAWMLLDALQIFIVCRHLTVTKFTHTYIIRRRYLYPSGYAVSALIVIISAAIYPFGYGSEKHCWLSLERGFRWSFQGPVCLVIVVNMVLYIWTLCLLRHHLSSRDVNVSKIKDTTTLTLKAAARLFVLGITWIFGIFHFNESTNFLSYLFTIINTLQGLFIFMVYCVSNRQVRDEVQKWFIRTSTHSTSNTSNVQMSSLECPQQHILDPHAPFSEMSWWDWNPSPWKNWI
ncbi:adhesion G protein-coupled receptor E2-like [Stegostoma tigrinum]|uniref:adhesion G protein-coupled receptor E2-like n=1 Tax=Stegostoma tigrinum TaxID=3053191 RepID=UPI00286FBF49|nr:adhesion G protein-coupled receptor E2-like [Stegostoma tigrinum]